MRGHQPAPAPSFGSGHWILAALQVAQQLRGCDTVHGSSSLLAGLWESREHPPPRRVLAWCLAPHCVCQHPFGSPGWSGQGPRAPPGRLRAGMAQLHHGSSLQPPCGCSLPAQPAGSQLTLSLAPAHPSASHQHSLVPDEQGGPQTWHPFNCGARERTAARTAASRSRRLCRARSRGGCGKAPQQPPATAVTRGPPGGPVEGSPARSRSVHSAGAHPQHACPQTGQHAAQITGACPRAVPPVPAPAPCPGVPMPTAAARGCAPTARDANKAPVEIRWMHPPSPGLSEPEPLRAPRRGPGRGGARLGRIWQRGPGVGHKGQGMGFPCLVSQQGHCPRGPALVPGEGLGVGWHVLACLPSPASPGAT